jgi:hypothetical protein
MLMTRWLALCTYRREMTKQNIPFTEIEKTLLHRKVVAIKHIVTTGEPIPRGSTGILYDFGTTTGDPPLFVGI